MRYLPDLRTEMARSAVTVSQCGYNTTMDILRARVPAVVVPFAEGGEDEQRQRAERLDDLGVLRCLAPEDLDADRLAEAVIAAASTTPAMRVAGSRWPRRHRRGSLADLFADRVGGVTGMSDWLDPVRAALDAASDPVPFFFRDDDAGWENELLWELLDRFEARQVHIDLAVIPAELDAELGHGLVRPRLDGIGAPASTRLPSRQPRGERAKVRVRAQPQPRSATGRHRPGSSDDRRAPAPVRRADLHAAVEPLHRPDGDGARQSRLPDPFA